jgi:group I intron endonuclease
MEALMSTSKENKLWGENVSIEPQQKSENRTVFEATGSMPITENDSVKSECKSTGKISGIYKVINKVNGKYYVGSSNDIVERWRDHRRELGDGNHVNDHLQKSWNKYGKESFDFIVIERVESKREMLIETEQRYLDVAGLDKDGCYNMNFEATGADPSDYVIEKLRAKSLALWKTPDYAQKVSAALRGLPSHRKGKQIPEKTRQKIIASRLHGKDNPRSCGLGTCE